MERVMLTSTPEKVDPRWTALIVVDMQNDYIASDGLFAKMALDVEAVQAIVEDVGQLIASARSAGIPVIFVRNWHSSASDSEAWLERSGRRFRGGPRAAEAGTWGAEWYPGIEPAERDTVIHKTRYDAFLRTDLDEQLRDRGIRTLVLCGTATNVCVESTARSAHMRDYYVVLVGDCCAASDTGLHRATLANIERHFGTVVQRSEVEAIWTTATADQTSPSAVGVGQPGAH
jgi:ureidoacrylate peracid hydrolase